MTRTGALRGLRHVVSVLLVCCALGVVVGCGDDSRPPAQAGPPPASARSSVSARPAVSAVSSFAVLRGRETGLVEYVQRRLRNRCLDRAGHPQNASLQPALPLDVFEGAVPTAHTFGPISEDEARRLGFGRDEPGGPARIVSFDPRYDRAFDGCSRAGWDALGSGAEQTYLQYLALANALTRPFNRALEQRLPPDLPPRSYVCMQRHGYRAPDQAAFLAAPDPLRHFPVPPGTYLGPADNWQPPRVAGTVAVGPPVAPRRYVPSPPESALAVAWYRCGVETRRTPAFLAASAAAQAELVGRHAADLARLTPEIDALARVAAQV